jgi:hypothetical protein
MRETAMNDEPESIWRKPWRGPAKVFAWFALLAGAVFLTIFGIRLALGQNYRLSDLIASSLAIAVCLVVSGVLVMLFVCWLCHWRNFRRSLFGVACLVTLIALFFAEENWRGKRAWENHRRQWEAKGEKFTFAALAPPPVPEEKNFALTPLLKPASDFTRGPEGVVWRDTNGLARLEQLRADLRPERSTNDYPALGSLEKRTFADLEAIREFYRGNTNYPQPASPGTAAEAILVALGKFDPEIKELREAAASRPYSRFPIEYDYQPTWGILLPHLSRMKGLCVLTQMRALAELEAGRTPEAFTDLKLGFRLSDSIRDEPLLIDHLVRIATLAVALQTLREGLVRHTWTDGQLAELEKYLASVSLLAEYKLGMRGERACSTAGLDWLRRQGFRVDIFSCIGDAENAAPFPNPGFNPFPGGWIYQNMLTVSRMHQDFTLAVVDDQARRVFPEVGERLDSTLAAMPVRPYSILARILMPAVGRAAAKSARMQTYVDAARVACALERHRLANGKLAGTLDALVPQFIEKIPTDVIDGKPLRYHLKPDGGYMLYSVGWNKSDDGGEVVLTKGKTPGVDATKGDWVWQMPAKK